MIIDFHTHVFPPQIKKNRKKYIDSDPCFAILYSSSDAKLATADELIDSMDKNGVDISVIVNIGWTTHELCVETNDYILEAIVRYPQRLVGFCAIQPNSYDAAIAEFEQWVSGKILSEEDLQQIRAFLQDVLDKEGIQMELPSLSDEDRRLEQASDKKNLPDREKGPFDITTVIFEWEWGSDKIGPMEFSDPLQSGNNMSIVVSPQEAKVFKPGKRLMNVQFYTPIAVFRSTVAIKGQTQIAQGPKQGHYRLDFAIEGN